MKRSTDEQHTDTKTQWLAAMLRRSARTVSIMLASVAMVCALALSGCASNDSVDPANPSGDVQAPVAPENSITVNVLIDCKDAVDADIKEVTDITSSGVMFDAALILDEGTTALEALEASGLTVNKAPGEFVYVQGIGGISEAISSDYPTSGWTYLVNGEMVMEACDKMILKDGDTLLWKYSLTYDENAAAA
jgi:hypothetical protein